VTAHEGALGDFEALERPEDALVLGGVEREGDVESAVGLGGEEGILADELHVGACFDDGGFVFNVEVHGFFSVGGLGELGALGGLG